VTHPALKRLSCGGGSNDHIELDHDHVPLSEFSPSELATLYREIDCNGDRAILKREPYAFGQSTYCLAVSSVGEPRSLIPIAYAYGS